MGRMLASAAARPYWPPSVVVATVMHGAANIATAIVLPAMDFQVVLIVTGAIDAVVAVTRVLRARTTHVGVAKRRLVGARGAT